MSDETKSPTFPYQGKNILVMGLGVHGGGVGVARYMARKGANVRVTDLRNAEQMQPSIDALAAEGLVVQYTLGEHREVDFEWADLIVKNPAVPNMSPWLSLARRLGKPVEMEISIFLRLCPAPVVGVTGTKGKSTTATWTWEMLRHWREDAVLAGNLRVSALDALDRITPQTPVVLELSSFQLEGLGEAGISPHLAAVTNLSADHLDRYSSMAEYGRAKKLIFANQVSRNGDCVVLNADDPVVAAWADEAPARVAWFGTLEGTGGRRGVSIAGDELLAFGDRTEQTLMGTLDDIQVPGAHNVLNAAGAATLALLAGAPHTAIRAGLRSFRGVADRLEYLGYVGRVRIYNDTTSTTPASTAAALEAVPGPLVLIAGGAGKGLDYEALAPIVARKTECVILLEGTATDLMERQFAAEGATIVGRFTDFENAVIAGIARAPEGGALLLSPAAASFGMFRNEFDRGDRFRKIISDLVENSSSDRVQE